MKYRRSLPRGDSSEERNEGTGAPPEKRDIFLSYRHLDGKEFATLLHERLRRRGFRVWFDDILLDTGFHLDVRIERAIETVGLYIPIISPGFCSPRCFAFKEFNAALKVQKDRALAISSQSASARPPEFIYPVLHGLGTHTAIRGNDTLLHYLGSHKYVTSGDPIDEIVDGVVKAFKVVEDAMVAVPGISPRIGRFPVTNLEYQRFISAGGYTNRGLEQWWTPEGIDFWLHYAARRPHRYFGRREDATTVRTEDASILSTLTMSNELFNHFAQPVTGVSLFEAEAYCRWLSQQDGFNGADVRLPTEAEWMIAAILPGHRYPWGDDPPTPDRINVVPKRSISETPLTLSELDLSELARIRYPSPCFAFPEGVSKAGCHDMFGNVWEWLGDRTTCQAAEASTQDRENVAKIAGHCCFDSPQVIESRSGPISYRRPGYRHHAIGFRVSVIQPSGD